MANWQLKLDIAEFYHKYPDELSLQEVAKKVSNAMKELEPTVKLRFRNMQSDFENIIDSFDELSNDEQAEVNQFDSIMDDLYDWGDTALDNDFAGKKLCWINTFGGKVGKL